MNKIDRCFQAVKPVSLLLSKNYQPEKVQFFKLLLEQLPYSQTFSLLNYIAIIFKF